MNNAEYAFAEALAKNIPLSQCPTCRSKPVSVTADVFGETPGHYRYKGETHLCDCDLQRALRRHYLAANIGKQYQVLDWADFDGTNAAKEAVGDYLDNWKSYLAHGLGIEFGGPLGVGKTFAATHIGKELIKQGQKVFFIPFVEMAYAFQREDADEIERRIREYTYLILDELQPAKWEGQETLFAVKFEAAIRHRTNHDLPTIITTNMTENDLHEDFPRVYSLLSAKQSRVDMSGDDVRHGKVADTNLEMALNNEVRPIT